MNKQIIIDGVDVSGCENYGETMVKTHNCILYDGYLRPCKGTDCYYKNWKRKEQECGQLRETMHKDICTHYVLGECSQEHHNNCVGRNQCIKDLERECDMWKNLTVDNGAVALKYQKQLDQLKTEIETLQQLKDEDSLRVTQLATECSRLKQAIEKIKDYCNKYPQNSIGFKQQILQICDEVLSE